MSVILLLLTEFFNISKIEELFVSIATSFIPIGIAGLVIMVDPHTILKVVLN